MSAFYFTITQLFVNVYVLKSKVLVYYRITSVKGSASWTNKTTYSQYIFTTDSYLLCQETGRQAIGSIYKHCRALQRGSIYTLVGAHHT